MINKIFTFNHNDNEYYLIDINDRKYITDKFQNSIMSHSNSYKVVTVFPYTIYSNFRIEIKKEITLIKLLEIFNVEYDLYFKDINTGEVVYKLDYFKFKRKSKLNRIIC